MGMAHGPALPAGDSKEAGASGTPTASLVATAPGTGTRDVAAKPAGLARARGAAGSAVKPLTAATAGPKAADGDSTTTNKSDATASTDATAGTDATAQMPAAAALALAGAGALAESGAGIADAADASAPSTDDSTAPAAVGMAQDAGNTTGLPAPALVVAAGRGVGAAPGAVMDAREIAAPANAGTADKHSQGGIGGSLLADGSGNAGAGAALMNGAPATAIDANPTPTMKVAAGVETPEFAQGIAERVSWMVDSNLNGAKLQVNPPQLGPIEVRIAVQGDNAQIWMTSHSAVTREALEASSPKLREMLGAQGFGQVSVDISQRSFQERPSQAQPYDWAPSANRPAATAPVSAIAATIRRISNGAVDAYA
jgi:flagellar hook-length control protein FliK